MSTGAGAPLPVSVSSCARLVLAHKEAAQLLTRATTPNCLRTANRLSCSSTGRWTNLSTSSCPRATLAQQPRLARGTHHRGYAPFISTNSCLGDIVAARAILPAQRREIDGLRGAVGPALPIPCARQPDDPVPPPSGLAQVKSLPLAGRWLAPALPRPRWPGCCAAHQAARPPQQPAAVAPSAGQYIRENNREIADLARELDALSGAP